MTETSKCYDRIFCLEGDWDGELTSHSSVLPMLQLLERLGRIEFVHRDVGTRAELEHYLDQWADKDESVSDYYVLYLAFHGQKNRTSGRDESSLWISDAAGGKVTLADLGKFLGPKFRDVIVHFGSCWILAADDAYLQDFLDQTDVQAMAGYTKPVDWVQSAALDLLFFECLARHETWTDARSEFLADPAAESLREELGFRVYPAP